MPINRIDEFAAVATEAATEAGKLLVSALNSGFRVSHKGEVNLVTELDLAAERLIIGKIRGAFPEHTILSEESYAQGQPGAYRWIIDPIDGTTNYAHGYPVFAVSVGLEVRGELEWGLVHQPMLGEVFCAVRGRGASFNGAPIRVSQTAALNRSLLATGFAYDIRTSPDKNLARFSEFSLRCQGVRRGGSAALDLCYVAAGRLDGFWEAKLSPWDCAAGYLIVREAGGTVTDYGGNPGSIYLPETVASNGLIHREILAVIAETPA